MEPFYIAGYLLAGILVSLYFDGILFVIGRTQLNSWQRSFAILFWPIVLLNLYFNED
jgi:hypothetical protein